MSCTATCEVHSVHEGGEKNNPIVFFCFRSIKIDIFKMEGAKLLTVGAAGKLKFL